ncbi:pyrroline-5-carboxylate reductase [Pelagibacterium mangrovi]|uniref:pyrroline-5-carboxylate reductase n=1 Tax=Pelagibacterium mangrovi TaxID=3119828 RepID=UPI002FCAB6A1
MSLADAGGVLLVGAGKMGMAMAAGWIRGGLPGSSLTLVDPQPHESVAAFAAEHGAQLFTELPETAPRVIVLAVKPQVMGAVLDTVGALAGPQTLVISIAAGISTDRIAGGTGSGRVVRAMPNTPAQIGKGISGAFAGNAVTDADRELAETILSAAGEVVWVEDEALIDAVTAVSGSGPAYVFHLVEAMAAAGEAQGLSAETAMALARQTVIGAAALMDADASPAGRLRENVTSPNGTTQAALEVLMAPDGLGALMDRAVEAARRRSEELGR